ncbi:MAG: hypothetical protein M3O33_09390 [Cyanobacteriota bacterium]|nr:hypothetical protein [Cyanobacteriota bacterium]
MIDRNYNASRYLLLVIRPSDVLSIKNPSMGRGKHLYSPTWVTKLDEVRSPYVLVN